MTRRFMLFSAVAIALAAGTTLLAGSRPAQDPITVTGCVERDAASSTPIFKIIVPQPKGSPAIYQLNAPGIPEVAGSAGKSARVTGTVSVEKRGGREIRVLLVKEFKVVADKCSQTATAPVSAR